MNTYYYLIDSNEIIGEKALREMYYENPYAQDFESFDDFVDYLYEEDIIEQTGFRESTSRYILERVPRMIQMINEMYPWDYLLSDLLNDVLPYFDHHDVAECYAEYRRFENGEGEWA